MTAEAMEILEELREETRRSLSPWRDIRGAAAHLSLSEAMIVKLANSGKLKRQYIDGTTCPRFRVADLDALLSTDYRPEHRRGRKAKEAA